MSRVCEQRGVEEGLVVSGCQAVAVVACRGEVIHALRSELKLSYTIIGEFVGLTRSGTRQAAHMYARTVESRGALMVHKDKPPPPVRINRTKQAREERRQKEAARNAAIDARLAELAAEARRNDTYTQKEIGSRIGVSRGLISLIERQAIQKLRAALVTDPLVIEYVVQHCSEQSCVPEESC